MKQADLYVFDVDGTIAPTNGMIDAETAKALLALHGHVPVVLSTGRSLGGLDPILKALPLPGPHAVSNGAALVTDGQTSHVFNALSDEDVATISTYLDSRGFFTVYCLADGNLRATRPDPRMDEVLEVGAWPALYGPLDGQTKVLKILTLCFEEEEGDIRSICRDTTEIHRTQFNMIEWTAPGSNKGVALDRQIALLGLEKPFVVAVGDSENDLALFAHAQRAIATANAAPAVKAAADHIMDSPVLEWIRRQIP